MSLLHEVAKPDEDATPDQQVKQLQAEVAVLLMEKAALLDRLEAVAEQDTLASEDQWQRLPDTVYSLRAMLDGAGNMRRADVAILSDAFGVLRELLLRRPAEFGGPKECR